MKTIAILGIDPAWTADGTSGIAVVSGSAGKWRVVAVAASYDDFIQQAGLEAHGRAPQPTLLIQAAERLSNVPISLVSVDVPLAHHAITCRRESDNGISRRFGSRGCSTHTPNAKRPGPISQNLYEGFSNLGYQLMVTTDGSPEKKMIEVYPHVALLRLLRIGYRLPYKVGKAYPELAGLSRAARIGWFYTQLNRIQVALDEEFDNRIFCLPDESAITRIRELKSWEDRLDALICCWMGILLLKGDAIPIGDEQSAIWIPKSLGS